MRHYLLIFYIKQIHDAVYSVVRYFVDYLLCLSILLVKTLLISLHFRMCYKDIKSIMDDYKKRFLKVFPENFFDIFQLFHEFKEFIIIYDEPLMYDH